MAEPSQQTIDRMAEIAKAQTKKVNALRPVAEVLIALNPEKGLSAIELQNIQHLATKALEACRRYDE